MSALDDNNNHLQDGDTCNDEKKSVNVKCKKTDSVEIIAKMKERKVFAPTPKEYFNRNDFYIPHPQWFSTPFLPLEEHTYDEKSTMRDLLLCHHLLMSSNSHHILQDVADELRILFHEYCKSYNTYFELTDVSHQWTTLAANDSLRLTHQEVPYLSYHTLMAETVGHRYHTDPHCLRKLRLFGKDDDTILHLAIKANAIDAAIEIIHIENNTAISLFNDYYTKRNITPTVISTSNAPFRAPTPFANVRSNLDCTILELRNAQGYTPLILAAHTGNVAIVYHLLKCQVQVKSKNNEGISAIAAAAQNGHTNVLKCIFSSFHNLLGQTLRFDNAIESFDNNGNSTLMHAVQNQHLSTVQFLLHCQKICHCLFEINHENQSGMTSLSLAVRSGNYEIFKLIIQEKHLDLNLGNTYKRTPLHLACSLGYVEFVRTLIGAGCNIYAQDYRKHTVQDLIIHRLTGFLPLDEIDINVLDTPDEDDSPVVVPSSTDKLILHLLDPLTQVDIMKLLSRVERNYAIVRVYTAYQKNYERVHIRVGERRVRSNRNYSLTDHIYSNIPSLLQKFDHPELSTKNTFISSMRSFSSRTGGNIDEIPLLKYLEDESTQALIRMMTLPTPLIRLIAQYMPLSLLMYKRYNKLLSMLSHQPIGAVIGAIDLMDEILEERGILYAFDIAKVPPPKQYVSWFDWRCDAIAKCESHYENRKINEFINDGDELDVDLVEPLGIMGSVPSQPKNLAHPTMYELRRQIGYIPLLAKYESILQPVLRHSPYFVPLPLIKSLIRISDVVILCRRCCCPTAGSLSTVLYKPPINFEENAARDILSLVEILCRWHERRWDRENFGWDHPAYLDFDNYFSVRT